MKTIIRDFLTHNTGLLAMAAGSLLLAQPSQAATDVWSANDATNSINSNWSDALNWSGGVPVAASSVLFTNFGAAAVPGPADNIVDANNTVLYLQYANSNSFHTTQINPGVTLTATNAAAGYVLYVGTQGIDLGSSAPVNAAIQGAGTLSVGGANVGSLFVVQQGGASGTHMATLTMSNLANFNLAAGRLVVGGYGGNSPNGSNYLSGTLYLAASNNIRLSGAAPALDVGDAINNGGTSFLYLGQTNAIFADSLTVGHLKAVATLAFNPTLPPGAVLYLNGNTNPRVTTMVIGDFLSQGASGSGSSINGAINLTGGTVNAQVNTCYIARGQTNTGAGSVTGSLTIGPGVFNVNTLFDGYLATNTAAGNMTATLAVTNGTLVVNSNLYLGYNPGATAGAAFSHGTLNITNGTVWANAITTTNVNSSSTINMAGGTLVVTNRAGTPAAPLTALNLTSATLSLAAGGLAANVSVSTLNLGDSGSVINVSSIPTLFGYPSMVPLISYSSLVQGATMNLGALPGTFTGYITNDMVSTIWLVVTGGPSTAKADEWGGGVNNLWNTTTLNWTNNGAAVPYSENDSVTFDDLGKTSTVSFATNHMPLGFVVTNNVLNYTLTGAGSIIGPVGMLKEGAASVTLAETGGDSFSGGLIITAGTVILDDPNCAISGGAGITNGAALQIGNNDTFGALPAGPLDDEGTLVFDRSDNILLANTVPGGGNLSTIGSGTFTLTNLMSFTGNAIAGGGTLALTGGGSLSNSASLLVSNATFDVSALAGQTTTLNNLSVTNATFTVALSGLQPAINVLSIITADGITDVSNKINVVSLPVLASYPDTLTVIQSSFISLANGNFNFILGSLPAGYTGFISESAGSAVVLTLTSGPIGVRANVTWSGVDALNNVSTNWSDRLNWQFPGVPTPVDNVIFSTAAAIGSSSLSSLGGGAVSLIPENINNFVDQNFAINTLAFTNLDASYHNTAITNGATLTITNSFTVGGLDSGGTAQSGFVTISGSQSDLIFTNPAGNVSVWNGSGTLSGSQATLDLSALDNFIVTANRLLVGASAGNTVNRPSGVLYLAGTNIITADYQTATLDTGTIAADSGLVVGDCVSNPGSTSSLDLGEVNVFTLDSIGIGRNKSSATLSFNPIYVNVAPYPTVTFQGYSSGSVTFFEVGTGAGNSGTTTLTADANLTGGIVTAAIGTLNIGRAAASASGTGTTTGSLEFDAGVITAATVNIGLQPVGNSGKTGAGTISVNANPTIGAVATLYVNGNLGLALNVNSSGTSGALDINGGSVLANNIVAGTTNANSSVTLSGGLLAVTNTMGTPAAPLGALNLSGGVLQLDIFGNPAQTNIVATSVTANGGTTLNIGFIANGLGDTTFPLISYTGADPFNGLTLGALPPGYTGTLVDNSANSRIDLNISASPTPLVWVGATGATPNGNWNFTTLNWNSFGSPATYADGESVQFDDTASNGAVTLAASVAPGEIYVTNNTLNYVFTGANSLNAASGVTKAGAGSVTFAESGADNFSAGIVAQSGTVIFARPNNLVIPGVVSGGGELVQAGGGVLTLNGANTYGGGTVISNGTLQLAYTISTAGQTEPAAGIGAITNVGSILAFTNSGGEPLNMLVTNIIAGSGAINLPQNQEINFAGPGAMSSYTGAINIPAGVTPTAKGDITSTNVNLNSAAIINVASGGTLWVPNANVAATINVSGNGNGEYFGALRVDTGGSVSGRVNLLGNTTIGGVNAPNTGLLSGVIGDAGAGYSLTMNGTGIITLAGNNTYGGPTIVTNGTLNVTGNEIGAPGSWLMTNNLAANTVDFAPGSLVVVAATNLVQVGSSPIAAGSAIQSMNVGGLVTNNGALLAARGSALSVTNGGKWVQNGPLTIQPPPNSGVFANLGVFAGGTFIYNGLSPINLSSAAINSGSGILTIGGGNFITSMGFTNSNPVTNSQNPITLVIGFAQIILSTNGTLTLSANIPELTGGMNTNASANPTISLGNGGGGAINTAGYSTTTTNVIGGAGNFAKQGAGTLTLGATNSYTGTTTVAGGTLLVNGSVGTNQVTVQSGAVLGGSGAVNGPVTVQAGGTIQGGDVNDANILIVTNLTLGNSSTAVTSSSFKIATGGKIAATALSVTGTNVVNILDASLTVGTNTLFTYGGGSIGGSSGFAGFQLGALPSGVTARLLNTASASVQLAVTSIITVNTNPPVLTNSVVNGTLTLSWPADHLGWRLQSQTNVLGAGLRANWFTVAGSTNQTSVSIPLNPASPSVFYRLVYP